MQVNRSSLRLGFEDDNPLPADLARTAAVFTLVGCCFVVVGACLPWLERTALGISLITFEIRGTGIVLPALALISGLIAFVVLLRGPPNRFVVAVLLLLAVVELGLAVSNLVSIREAVAEMGSRQVWAKVIGTGSYATVLGAAMILAGGVSAWMKRTPRANVDSEEDAWR